MKNRLGIIAEDRSDVEVVAAIAVKVASGRPLVVRSFVGHGCGKLRCKSRQWATNLREQQCNMLVLVHDLDKAHLPSLQAQLAGALYPSPIAHHILVIPVHEIEAWLLSDGSAIKRALNIKSPMPKVANPETIFNPKERLERLVYSVSHRTKRYLSTVHNRRIATELDLNKVRRCRSFAPLEAFLRARIRGGA
jgi:uncharacterized protein DUF4276